MKGNTLKQIRTAVLGFGTAGRVFHAPLIAAEPRFSLDAIVTSSTQRSAQAQSQYPGTEIIPSTTQLFARAAEFDLVVVGTPNESHARLAREAIAANLNVVVDKPVAVTSVQAETTVREAAERGVVFSVFQNRRWDGDFITVKESIERGDVGDVHQFESAFEWWKPQVGDGWKDLSTPDAGGGILYDLGPHLIDQALQLFGEVEKVHAELDRRRPGVVNDDDTFLTLCHSNGVRTRLWMNAAAPAIRPRFRVLGSRGVLTTHGLDPQELQSIQGMLPRDEGFGLHPGGRSATLAGPDYESGIPIKAGIYLDYYRRLADAILDGKPAPVDAADSIRALKIIEAAIFDAEQG